MGDATVLDKDVALRFRHALKGDTDLRAKFDVDDKTSATLTYDLTNFGSPDLKSLSVAAKYQHNSDTSIEPAYNMGTESFSVTVDHRLDSDNSLQAKYDQGSNVGSLEWTLRRARRHRGPPQDPRHEQPQQRRAQGHVHHPRGEVLRHRPLSRRWSLSA